MVSLQQQEQVVFLNSQYQDNSELIDRLSKKLLQDIDLLDLSPKDILDTKEYIKDKVNIFRFLRESKFDLEIAHEELLKTISWRIEKGIADLSFESCIEYFEKPPGAFAFFHNRDKLNRPLIFVRLRYFPTWTTKKLIHHIEQFACLMMEIGRKLTWDITCERESKNEHCVLVSQITAVVNILKAPMLPMDAEIIKTMSTILDKRFPGMISSVNILNFGWMYQGIWTIAKFLLSEEAKNSIKFTSVNELKSFISPDSILQEMGGNDTFDWSIDLDQVLQKYGTGRPIINQQLPNTPPISPDNSRSNSISDIEDDIFFDANDVLPSIPLSPPLLENNIPLNTSTLTSRAGLRMGTDFLTSFIDTPHNNNDINQPRKLSTSIEQVYQPSSIIVVNEPSKKKVKTGLKQISKKLTHHLLQLTFGKQKGAMYWILLYFFLRGPVEIFIKKSLQSSSMIKSNYVSKTTIGITGVIATVFSTSLLNTIEKYSKENLK